MKQIGSLMDWLKEPKAAESYRKWLRSPITKQVVEQLEQVCRPTGLPPMLVSGDNALYLHGVDVGAAFVLDLIKTAPEMAASTTESQEGAPDYGAQDILKEIE